MRFRTGYDVLQYELLEQQASTIGQLGRDLRAALDALAAVDRHDPERRRLLDDAAYALWVFVVQRDCSGFHGTEHVLKDFAVPAEVRARMGAVTARRL